MKKLLSAIWAKALAFLLTPLAGVAAVNGVSEVIMVYFYDVWSPHPVWLLVVTVLCAVVTVGSLLFSLSAAGHWPGHEGIHLTWLDRIPLDVFVLALAGEWLIYGNASYYPSSVLGMVVFVALAYLFILAFTARCKAGIVLADLVVLRLLRLLSRGAVWAWRHLRVLVLSLPLTWKTAAELVALMAAELLMLAYDLNEAELAVYLTLHILILGAAMWQVLALRQLQQGGESLAKGDFSHPITLSRGALPELKRHAANLNSVQQGIQQAVEEKMKSERLKTQLITNVSHDIKTPLTSIVNYVDLLKKEEMPSNAAREYLAVLDRQSQRLRKLTEDLVEASKASTGNIPVSLAPTDLNVLLSQVCGEYQQRLEKQVLEPVLSLCEPGAAAMADGRLLWRVLDNLMSNICKYAMPGTRVYLTTEKEGDTARMVVKNISRYPLNISADELTERFVRGDSSRSTEGSGLGLSIAKENLPAFRKAVNAWAAQEHPVLKRPALRLDAPLALSGLKEEDVAALSVLAPFGHGNPTPVFLVENAVIDAVYPLSEGKHTRLRLKQGGGVLYAAVFGQGPGALGYNVGDAVDAAVCLSVFEGKNGPMISARIKELRPAGLDEAYLEGTELYEALMCGAPLTESQRRALLPARADTVALYRAVGAARDGVPAGDLRPLFAKLGARGAGKALVSLEALRELSLLEQRETPQGARWCLVPAAGKKDLASAPILRRLEAAQ